MRALSSRAGLWTALGLATLMLPGCVVGPNFSKPAPPAPPQPGFYGTTPDVASKDEPPPNWWQLYSDPAIDQLVQEALTNNKSLEAAAANLAQARAALSQARAGLFPSTQTSAGAQYGVSDDALLINKLKGLGAPSPTTLFTAGLDASYEVDFFGRVRRTIEAAKADYEAQAAAEDISRISVAGETTRAYLNACAYTEELLVANQSLTLVTQTYDVTVRQAQDGAASDFDVARAREQVENVRASLPNYLSQRRVALYQLAVLTGRPPEEISAAADACKVPPKLTMVLPVGDAKGLFRRRPDVRQAERQLAAAVARIGVATADLYPTITIGGSVATASNSLRQLGSVGSLTYGIGPLLNWSFPNTLVAQAEIRQARAVASAGYANFQGAVLQALQDTETALTNYGGEIERNTSLTNVRDQSQIAFNIAQVRYREGSASYLDLLTAQSDLVNASQALAASDQTLASDQVTVFKALGGGWEQAPPAKPLPVVDGRSGKSIPVN